ncbi:MAG: (Fe-S)-binding protein [Desulfovibrionaceae bacterium]|nr:(Fe-S)-binding protein [Desulfovibrionaceae bacterium]
MSDALDTFTAEACAKQAALCLACGTCLQTCPVYAGEPREILTARGRNNRIHELLRLKADPEGLKDIGKCLLCGRCTMVCPRGIRNDLIVSMLRQAQVDRNGLPTGKKIAFRKLLLNRKAMRRTLRAASRVQGLLPETADVQAGFSLQGNAPAPIRHLPALLPRFARGRNVPSIASEFLSDALPEETPAVNPSGKPVRVAYFSGCAAEFLLPDTGKAVVRLLSEAGMDVVFPKEQGCCGLAVHANGDHETARRMALHNLDVLEKCRVDSVVTGCATCGSAMRDMWPRIGNTPEETARLAAMAIKVKDVSEIVLAACDFADFSCRSALPKGATVTWHEPCHLARLQHVSREPLTILQRTFGDDFRELSRQGCCGFGGSFNLYNYDLSREIGSEKAAALRESGAEYVITSCPGCLIQLADTMARHKIPGRIVHLAEAVAFRK